MVLVGGGEERAEKRLLFFTPYGSVLFEFVLKSERVSLLVVNLNKVKSLTENDKGTMPSLCYPVLGIIMREQEETRS